MTLKQTIQATMDAHRTVATIPNKFVCACDRLFPTLKLYEQHLASELSKAVRPSQEWLVRIVTQIRDSETRCECDCDNENCCLRVHEPCAHCLGNLLLTELAAHSSPEPAAPAWPKIPAYLKDPKVFLDKNLGMVMVAGEEGDQWIYRVHDGHWCSVRKVGPQDPLFVVALNEPIAESGRLRGEAKK